MEQRVLVVVEHQEGLQLKRAGEVHRFSFCTRPDLERAAPQGSPRLPRSDLSGTQGDDARVEQAKCAMDLSMGVDLDSNPAAPRHEGGFEPIRLVDQLGEREPLPAVLESFFIVFFIFF